MLPALGTPSARSIFEVNLRRRTTRREEETWARRMGDAARPRTASRGKLNITRGAKYQGEEAAEGTRQSSLSPQKPEERKDNDEGVIGLRSKMKIEDATGGKYFIGEVGPLIGIRPSGPGSSGAALTMDQVVTGYASTALRARAGAECRARSGMSPRPLALAMLVM